MKKLTTRTLLAALSSLLFAGLWPSAVAAQQTSWLPWIGCWEGAADVGAGLEGETFLVCFETAPGASTVQIVTYGEEGDVVATEEMFADGEARPIDTQGCTGTRTAGWSAHGTRVFLQSRMDCGGVERLTSGVLSMLPGGDGWVEVQAVRAGSDDPVIGIRSFLPASAETLVDLGITDPADPVRLAIETARAGASQRMTPAGLVETVERTGPEVTSALLVERGEDLRVDAGTLEALADRGVPGEVLDVMVAMSYPERFAISGGEGSAEPEVRAANPRPERAGVRGRNAYGYSPWMWSYGAYGNPYRYAPYSSMWLRRSGFGYGYYDPYYSGIYDRPRYIVIQPPTVENRARLSRERGLVPGATADDEDRGSSSVRVPDSSRDSSPSTTRRPSSRSSGDRPSASSGSGSSSSGGDDDVRRARPR